MIRKAFRMLFSRHRPDPTARLDRALDAFGRANDRLQRISFDVIREAVAPGLPDDHERDRVLEAVDDLVRRHNERRRQ